MRRFFPLAAAAVMLSLGAAAQTQAYSVSRFGLMRDQDGNWTYRGASTALSVELTVRTRTVVTGPYARYSQTYLGVIAPMTDKVECEILSADITDLADVSPQTSAAESQKAVSLTRSDSEFLKVPVDRSSSAQRSQEQMAKEAAETVFALRRHRMDLISGEMGENVFGAGLGDALREIDRLENEYLALFLGKTVESVSVRRFTVTPVSGQNSYVVCRFLDSQGIMPEDDLSGEPVVLDIRPSGDYDSVMPHYASKDQAKLRTEKVAIADNSTCRILSGTTVLAEKVLPVFQFGTVYDVDPSAF